MRNLLLASALVACVALAGCAGQYNQPFVSAQNPPAANSAMSEPEPITSLPRGAGNISSAPGATQPNFAGVAIRAF